jgi:hypothetical protein
LPAIFQQCCFGKPLQAFACTHRSPKISFFATALAATKKVEVYKKQQCTIPGEGDLPTSFAKVPRIIV